MAKEQKELDLDIVFDFEAILFLEDEHNMNIIDGGLSLEDAGKPKTYITLLRAGLMHKEPDITEEQAKAKIKGIPARLVVKAIVGAVKEAIGGDEEPIKASNEEEATAQAPGDPDASAS